MYWSMRRELWENRSIYIAPLIVAAVVLFGSCFSVMTIPRRLRTVPPNNAVKQHAVVVSPFSIAPAPIIMTTFLVAFFYALDALYGERRDRSILFWKSLPVSDLTTVLSKVSIVMVVLPVVGIVLSQITQLILLMIGTMALPAQGISAATLWSEFRFFQEPVVMVYGLAAHVLWFAPIYGWLLLVSAWARRTPVLWAVLPFLAISAVEKMTFNTAYFGTMLRYRFVGAMTEAFVVVDAKRPGHGLIDRLSQLDPVRFVSTPGLWVGLVFAAVCVAAAVRLRRNREPI
jgi:ABC-2 type transport system permease protein